MPVMLTEVRQTQPYYILYTCIKLMHTLIDAIYCIAGNIGRNQIWCLGPNRLCKNIGRFKFGGSVRDHHTYICKYEILAEFNLAVANQTTKLPNLILHQIFRLCMSQKEHVLHNSEHSNLFKGVTITLGAFIGFLFLLLALFATGWTLTYSKLKRSVPLEHDR